MRALLDLAYRVHQVGPGVQSFKVGDAVLLSLDHCGACRNCRKKKSTACLDWTTLNLSFRRPSDGSYCVARDQQGQEVKGMFFGQSSFSQYTLAAVNSARLTCKYMRQPDCWFTVYKSLEGRRLVYTSTSWMRNPDGVSFS
jgi:D-arabinose 1-dehydrogenase-like Zn-dependent alcohol dehydrogenase